MQQINEAVEVEAGFWGTKVVPLWFVWRGRKYNVLRVTMTFERQDGGRKYLCFVVETGGMIAELVMDVQNFQFLITNFQPGF